MSGFHFADILVQPVISERTNELMAAENKYVFLVAQRATKNDIKRAVGERFKVHVTDVNIINLPRKPKKVGRHSFQTERRRKAIISVRPGERILELSEAI
jgi:large subunit ribosomal protein L23